MDFIAYKSKIIRLLALTVFLLLSAAIQAQNTYEIFEREGRFGLRNEFLEVLIDAKYQGLGWYPETQHVLGEFIGYKQAGKWGLITADGKKVTDAKYYSIAPFSRGLFLVSAKGALSNQLKYGLIDSKGKLLLSNTYFEIASLDKYFMVSEYDQGALRYGLFSERFEPILPVNFSEIRKIEKVIAAKDTNGFWRFYDLSGALIHGTKSDDFTVHSPHIIIQKNGAVGLINARKGQLLFPTTYKGFTLSDEELLPISARNWQVYDWSLKKVAELEADSVSSYGELLVSHLNDGQRFFTDSLEILIDNQLALVLASDGFAIAKTDDYFTVFNDVGEKMLQGDSVFYDGAYFFAKNREEWDVYNLYGRKINPYPLQAVQPSQSLYIPVKRAGQWGLLDFSGKQIVPHVYDSIGLGIDSSFPAEYVGSWGVINAFGNWLVHPGYYAIRKINDLYVGEGRGFRSLLTAKGRNLFTTRNRLESGNESIQMIDEEGKGLITTTGLVIFDPIYESVRHFGDFYVGNRPEGAVIKDGLGAFVVSLDRGVEQVLDYSEDFFLIKKDGLFGFLDEKGRIRIANRYDSARHFSDEMAPIKLIGKWGFINKSERIVVQPQFLEVGDFQKGRAIVRRDYYGLVDKEGNMVLEVAYRKITRTVEGTYILEDQQGRKGLANAQGEIILSPSFDEMQDIGHGLIIADRKGRKGLYDHSGSLQAGFDYEMIIPAEAYIFMSPIKR